MEEKEWLTVEEVAKKLGFAESTIRGWIVNGELKAARFGKKGYRIKREDYDQFVKDHYDKPQEE
jgi:excisionase family DNA binding protein